MSPLPKNVSFREFERALLQDGFSLDHSSGAHRRYLHPDGRRVTLSYHGKGRTITRVTLKRMIEQACWDDADLRRLGFSL